MTIRTVFFAAEPRGAHGDADVVGCVQSPHPGAGFELVRTLHIDLTRDARRLFAGLGKSTKNQVNRALKDDALSYTAIAEPTEEHLAAFRAFYNDFARTKGTTLCRTYQVETMRLLMKQRGLVLTRVADAEGAVLCYHAYVADGTRAMLLYSGSQFRAAAEGGARNRLARAHRYLHWQDILFFKSRGFRVYDCGGLTDDPRVGEFKRSFGGTEVTEYTGYVPVTWKGRAAAQYRGMLSHVRRHVFSPSEAA